MLRILHVTVIRCAPLCAGLEGDYDDGAKIDLLCLAGDLYGPSIATPEAATVEVEAAEFEEALHDELENIRFAVDAFVGAR